jgi:SAM-dependent methyltransferase
VGIPRPVARLLFEEGRRRPFGGSVLQLGRCAVYLTWDELASWARRDGFRLAQVPFEPSHDPALARLGCVSDRTFFGALGFERVESLDLLADERPTFVHDLNGPLPAELEGRFDVVFDTGTLIHVFDQRAAFANLGRALRQDGRAIHNVPSTNHVDVGLYMHSPQLFADFYAANGWRLETLRFCEFEPLWFRGRFVPPRWRAYDYRPGALDRLGIGGWGARPAATWAVATRVAGATVDRVPLQGASRPAAPATGDAPSARPRAGPEAGPGALDPLLRGLKRLRRRLPRATSGRRPPLAGDY